MTAPDAPTPGEIWDHDDHALTDEDHGWLAEWWAALDDASERARQREAEAAGEPPPVPQRKADLEDGAQFVDVLRHYMVDSAGLDTIPDPDPLIGGILYLDSLAWLIGRPGCGKSLVALDWAGCIGSGLHWSGFRVVQRPVVYVSPESPGGVKLRVRAWESANGRRMEGVHFLPVAPQAQSPGHFQALGEVCREVNAGLIILDTQARVTLGLEENSSKEMGVFIDRLERLRDATKACILTVHHTPRGADHLRGSTALEGAAGTIVTAKKDGNVITLAADPDHGGKTKDTEPFRPVDLRLVPYEKSVIVTDTEITSGDQQISPDVASSLSAWWQSHGSDDVAVSLLIRTEIFAERTFHRSKKALIAVGLVEKIGTGRSVRYRLTRDPANL